MAQHIAAPDHLKFIEPSEEELRNVESLQKRLKENPDLTLDFTPIKILRFLRGRKGDMDKAYRALCKHDQWYREMNVATISELEFSSEVRQKLLFGKDCRLKDGQPVVYIVARRHDANHRDVNELRNFIIYSFHESLKLADPREERINIVFDLHHFGLHCMDYEAVRIIIDTLSFNYPETLNRAFIINHPMLFSACWYVIHPWIDETTRHKVLFCSPADLVQHMDSTAIPTEIFGIPRPAVA